MMTLASNSLRLYLAPARREQNPGIIGTVLLVGVVVMGYGIYRGVKSAKNTVGRAVGGLQPV